VPQYLGQTADINDSNIDWEFADIPATPNLLQGDFKPRSSQTSQASWLPVMGLAALALVLLFAYLQISNNLLGKQVQQLEQQLVSGSSKLFGTGNINAADVRSLAEQRLSYMFAQQQSLRTGAVVGLTALDSLMSDCECNLVSMTAGDDKLSLIIDSGSKLKSRALNIPGYQTSITQQPNRGEDSIVLTLTAKAGGGR
jgi:hypothetical protein